MSQPAAGAVLLDQLAERRDAADAHHVEQLRAALLEVLAEGVADLDAGFGQLGLDQPLDQGHTRPATGAGLGAGLDRRDVGAALLVDRAPDGAGADVVARADVGLVGQAAAARRLDALGQQPRGGIGSERSPDQRPQARVRRGVADEHPAEQGGRVVAHDELLVDTRDRVGVDDLEAALGGGERVAEAGDVDAQQLELGAQVGALERGLTAEQPVDDDLGHRVAGSDEAPHPAGDVGDLADRVHVRVAGAAGLVGDHSASLVQVEAGVAGQLVARADAGGEHDDVDVHRLAVGELHARDPAVATGAELRRRGGRADVHVELLDQASQRLAAGAVDLQRHQPVGELDDGGLGSQSGQGAGSLQPEQATTDHRSLDRAAQSPAALLHPGTQLGDVVDGAVDERSGQLGALDGWHRRIRAGGQDESVVVERAGPSPRRCGPRGRSR